MIIDRCRDYMESRLNAQTIDGQTLRERIRKKSKLLDDLELEYFKLYNGDYSAIVADVSETLDAIVKMDFENYLEFKKKSLRLNAWIAGREINDAQDPELTEAERKIFIDNYEGISLTAEEEAQTAYTYDNCIIFLTEAINSQLRALEYFNLLTRTPDEIRPLIEAKAAELCPDLPRVRHVRPNKLDLAIDKINSNAWNLLKINTDGQLRFNYDFDMSNSKDTDVLVLFSVDFEEVQKNVSLSKTLTPFDKRVYMAAGAVIAAGNDISTLTQVYYAMGYKTLPKSDLLEKINNSIVKMSRTMIHIDNTTEAQKYKYDKFTYDGYLLPLERVTAIMNNKVVDAAIHFFREPPLLKFARDRRQITKIPIRLLQGPLSKTETNLEIEDYILERIAREKNKPKTRHCTILIDTLFDKTGITRNKGRKLQDIEKLLTYYQEQEHIKSFKITADKIQIYF